MNDPSLVYFTSGTTGMPKMVQHTQTSYPFGHVITGLYWLNLKPGKVYWNMSEQGWAKAAWSFLSTFVSSPIPVKLMEELWSNVICSRYSRSIFYPEYHNVFTPLPNYNTLCSSNSVSSLVLPESIEIFKHFPPKSLEHCVGAGEPLNPEVIRQWKQLTGLDIHDGYGQVLPPRSPLT
jgi:adenosine deaminase CECR1